MLENDSDLEELEDIDIDYNDDNEDISVTNIFNLSHPTIDNNAKQKLQDIFIEDLKISNYLKNFINNNQPI